MSRRRLENWLDSALVALFAAVVWLLTVAIFVLSGMMLVHGIRFLIGGTP